jgi:hypothetical protein
MMAGRVEQRKQGTRHHGRISSERMHERLRLGIMHLRPHRTSTRSPLSAAGMPLGESAVRWRQITRGQQLR